jgi:hypothetical protein
MVEMLNGGQIIKNMDIDVKELIYLTFSVLLAIKLVLGEITIINMSPKAGRVVIGIIYLILCYICMQYGLTFFAGAFFIFSLSSIVMAAVRDYTSRLEHKQFEEWQKYISDKLKEQKDKKS